MSMDRYDRIVVEKFGDAWPFAVAVAEMLRLEVERAKDGPFADHCHELRAELARTKDELERVQNQDRAALEEHQAAIINLSDKDLLAIGGRLLDRAEEAESLLAKCLKYWGWCKSFNRCECENCSIALIAGGKI